MFQRALMVKITEPSGELYEFKALSDQELLFANKNFVSKDLPYRVCRPGECNFIQQGV
tara:strand:+ start:163 stop:336 length:174 start_codon:yes stop_codon:yes gene_type:complete